MSRWFRNRPGADEIREELEAHLAMRAAHDGTGKAAARRRFGNVLLTQEEVRRVWVAAFLDTLVQDARSTWRSWRRNPSFAVGAVAVLAVGLGASIALFGALDRILFRELPYSAPDRLVSVGLRTPLDANEFLLAGDYTQLWRPMPQPFEAVTTLTAGSNTCDLTEDRPERLNCQVVETNLLKVLGVRVAAGRDFSKEDAGPGPPREALVRSDLADRRFGDAGRAVGKTFTLDGHRVEIVGVLPVDFELPNLATGDVLLPQWLAPDASRSQGGMLALRAYGRLKSGVTAERAQAELAPIFTGMVQRLPAPFRGGVSLRVRALRDYQVGGATRTAWLLVGAVGVLMLIACIDVANLQLARLAARQRDFAVRVALGAERIRLARLVLTESLLLAAAGCGVGLLLARGLLRVFVSIAPSGIPKIAEASIDPRAAAAAVILTLAVGLATGSWPMATATGTGPPQGARTTAANPVWARFGLVTAQIALTIALLGSAALLLRSLWNRANAPLGFDTANVMTVPLTLSAAKYPEPQRRVAIFEQILERAGQTPGVLSTALSDSLPPFGAARSMALTNMSVTGSPVPERLPGGIVTWRVVTPAYFRTLGVPVVRGRDFETVNLEVADSAAPPIIINETLARTLLPGVDPIGQQVMLGRNASASSTVVGVVRDTRDLGAEGSVEPEYFMARRGGVLGSQRSVFLLVRTGAGPVTSAYLRQTIHDVDPQLPFEIQAMQQRIGQLAERPRFVAWLLVAFAGLAVLLSAMGLYGVASYLVTQRRREIGVRMALGAKPGDIARDLLRDVGRWLVAGAALGCALAWAATRTLQSQLYGMTRADRGSWVAALTVLSAALLIAVLMPTISAARVDPAVALRSD